MSYDQEIGQKVRCFRKVLGLSQHELADKIGVSYQQLQKYETGANRISVGRLKQIGDAMNMDIVEFFNRTQEPSMAGLYHICKEHGEKTQKNYDETVLMLNKFLQIEDKNIRKNILNIVDALSIKSEETQ